MISEVNSLFFSFYSTPPDNVSIQEFQKNEAVDVEVHTYHTHPVYIDMILCGGQHRVLFISGGPADQHRDFTFCQFHPKRLCWTDHDDAQ